MDLWLSDPHFTLVCKAGVIQNVKSADIEKNKSSNNLSMHEF